MRYYYDYQVRYYSFKK